MTIMITRQHGQANLRYIPYFISFLLGVAVASVACGLVIERLRISRNVFKSVAAGATKEEIEAKYGPPKFHSSAGQRRGDVGWNGEGKNLISKVGMNIYDASLFEFIVCEFDESDTLERVFISTK